MALFRKVQTRYFTKDGKRCRRDTQGAIARAVQSKTWSGRYKDADGILREKALSTNKAAARILLGELVVRTERSKSGLSDRFEEHHKTLLKQHLDDFKQHLAGKGNCERHVKLTFQRVQRVLTECQWRRIGDIDGDSLNTWLKDRRDAEDFGASTSNGYLTAVKSFTRWLVRSQRTARDPLAFLSRVNTAADIRRTRRALSVDDFGLLIDAARESSDTICGLSGESREMLYVMASYTGLRASELASLTERSIDFDSEPPTVTVEAAYSKHRQRDVLPLHPELALRLRGWLSERSPGPDNESPVLPMTTAVAAKPDPLWPGRWAAARHAAEMLRHDLEEAEIPYVDESGAVFDFHALRGQFITEMARNGVSLVVASKLARHGDPSLTARFYTHLNITDLAGAVDRLPSIPTGESDLKAANG